MSRNAFAETLWRPRLRPALACALTCIAAALGGMQQAFAQTSGTWINAAGGSWSGTSNWASGTVANGAGALANFGTLDITASRAITLDSNRTIGRLIFGDTTWTSSNLQWTLQSGTLTLDNTGGTGGNPPSITVNNSIAIISSVLAGSDGLSVALPWSNYDATRGTTNSSYGMVFTQTAGLMIFSGSNTLSGSLSLSGGTTRVQGAGARFGNVTALSVGGNGTFLNGDPSTSGGAANNNGFTNRIGDGTARLTLGGAAGAGTFQAAFGTASGSTTSQTFGSLTINAGRNVLTTINTAAGTNNLIFTGTGGGGYVRTANGLVNVVPATGFNPQFTNAPTTAGGSSVAGTGTDAILTGAILNGSDFIAATSGTFSAAGYATTLTAGKNVSPTGDLSTSGNTSINSLRLANTTKTTVTIGSNDTLTIASGGILVPQLTGVPNNVNHTITGGSLTSSAGDLWIYATGTTASNTGNADLRSNNYGATIASKITGDISLTVGGNNLSQVLLSGANDYTGGTFLAGGLVVLNADSGLGAAGGSVTAVSDLNSIKPLASFSTARNFVINSGALLQLGGTSNITTTVTGSVSGGGQLELGFVAMSSRVILSATNSGFTGQYLLMNVLRADEGVGLSSNANLLFNASNNQSLGVLETNGSFTRALGSGAGQVQWQVQTAGYTSGGFAAVDGALSVNLGGNGTPDTLTWGSTYFLPGNAGVGGSLVFGSPNSTADVTFQNSIALNGAQRAIYVTAAGTTKATMSGVLSGDANSGINKWGTGTLVLSGSNTYGGRTSISAGTLSAATIGSVSGTGNLGAPTSAANGLIQFGNGSTGASLLYTGTGETTDRMIDMAGSTGGATLDQSGSGLLKFTGLVTATTGLGGNKTLTLQGSTSGSGEIAGVISNNTQSNTTVSAAVSGTNVVVLASTTGIVVGGTISGPAGIPAGTTITALSGGTATLSANTTSSIANGAAVAITGLNNPVTVSKAGTGTWTLSGANTYTGVTSITGGVLSVSTLADGGVASGIGAATSDGGNLVINGGILQYTGASVSTNRGFTINTANTGTFDVTLAATTLTLTGSSVSAGGALTKAGAGTLAIAGALANSGVTTINAGALQIGNGGATGNLGGGNVSIASGATLAFNRSDAYTFANNTSGSGGVTILSGSLTLSKANTYTGQTTVAGGVLVGGIANAFGTSAPLAVNSGTVNVNGFAQTVGALSGSAGTLITTSTAAATTTLTTSFASGTSTFAGTIADSGSGKVAFTKSGAGTQILSGNNTFTGGLTISAGTLLLGPGAGLSGSNAITVDGGTFDLGGSNQTTTGVVSFANTSTLQGGTLTSNNASVNGANNEVAGTLTLGTGGAFITNRRLLLGNSTSGSLTIAAGSAGSVTFGGDNSGGMNYVGNGTGTATLTINGGTVNFTNSNNGSGNGYLIIGANSNAANGTVVVNGGNMNVGTWMKVGGIFDNTTSTNSQSFLSVTSGTVTVGGGSDTTNNGIVFMNGGSGDAATGTTGTSSITLGAGGVLVANQIQTGKAVSTITFDGGTLKVGASGSSTFLAPAIATALTVNVNAGGATIDTGASSITITPVLRDGGGGGGLTKLGNGSLTLSATNTYTGNTTINAGTLEVASTGRLGSAGTYSGALSNNGTFIYSGTNNQTLSGLISGSGSLTHNASSTLTLSGTMSLSGAANAISTTANGAIDITGKLSTAPGSVLTLAVGGGASTSQTRLWGSSNTIQGEVLVTGGSGTGSGIVWSNTPGVNSLSGATKITVASGNTLRYSLASIDAGTAFDLNGTGNGGRGALSFYDSGTSTVSGPVNLSGNASIVSRNAALTLAGTITESGGARALTLVADPGGATTQVYTLSGSNSFSGGLTFTALDAASASTKLLAGSSAAFGTGALTLNSLTQATATAIVDLNGQAITIGGLSGGNLANANSFIQSDSGAAILTVNQAADGTFAGIIRNGTGSVALTKSGNGTLTLSGSNTYSGTTTLSAGALQVGNASALGSGTISFAGGTLQYGSGITTDLSGRVSAATGQQFNVDTNGQSVTWTTALVGANNTLTKLGSGTLALSGANTYSGATSINAGTLQIGSGTNTGALNTASTITGSAGATLAFNRSDAFNQSSVVNSVIGGNINVTQLGSGTVTLNGVNTYTGTTSVVGFGRLIASSANSLGTGNEVRVATNGGNDYGLEVAAGVTITGKNLELSGVSGRSNLFLNSNSTWAGNITFTNGGQFNQIFTSGTNVLITGTISAPGTYSGGGLGVGLRNTGGGNTGTVSGPILAGSNTVNAYGGTWTFTNTNNTMGSLSMQGTTLRIREAGQLASGSYAGRIVFATGTTGLFDYGSSADQILSGLISGSGSVTQGGAGTLTISSATNTYVGVTTVNAGILSVANLANGGVNSAIGASSSAAANLVLGGGRLRYTGDSVTTDRSFTLTASTTSTIDVSTAATTLTFTGTTASTSGALTKAGAGTLVLAGAAAYTGQTTVAGGVLLGGTTNAFGSSAPLAVNSGTVNLGGFAQTVGALSGSAGTLITTSTGAGSATLTASFASGTSTFAGSIADNVSGTVAFTKSGAGTQVFAGDNTYTGTTSINAGRLQIGNGSTTGAISASSAITGSSGATLAFNRTDNYGGNFANTIGGGVGLTLNSGSLTLSATNTYTGTTTVNAGTLQIGSGSTTGAISASSAITGSSGATLAFNRTDNYGGNFANTIGGGLGLTLSSGSLTLSATNTYTGDTAINAGTLEIASTGRLGSAGTYSGGLSNNGTFIYSGTNIQTISGLTTGSGSFTNNAASTLTFSGSMALSGASNAISTTGNGTLDISGNLSTAPGSVLTLTVGGGASTGPIRLSGAGNIQGEVIVTGGSGAGSALVWSYAQDVNSLNGATKITVASGNTMRYWSASIGAGTAFDLNGTGNGSRGAISFYGGGTSTISGPVNLSDNSSIASRNAALTLAGNITESGGARALTLVADPGGATTQVHTLGGSNNFSGGLTFNALNSASASTKLVAGSATAFGTGALTLNSLTQATATAIVDLNGQAITIGGLSGGNLANANSFIQSDSGAAVLTVNQATNGTFSGIIRNGSGSVALIKSGTATLTLAGANTFSGNTRIGAGTLAITNASALLNSTLDLNALDSGTVSFSQNSTLGGLTGSRDLNMGGRTISIGNNDQSTSYSGTLSNGALTKIGVGMLTLSGSNAYSGGTVITGGTIRAGSASALGSGALALDAGSLDLYANTVVVGLLSGSAGTSISSSAGAARLVASSAADSTFAGVISDGSGPVGFTKAGLGKLTFTGSQSYTGSTIISGGTLALASGASLAQSIYLQAGAALGDGGVLDVTALGGGLEVANGQKLGGYGTVLGDVTIAGGAIVAPGGSIGTLDINGTQTWGPGGRYLFEITNANGSTPGTDWDLLTVNALTITATSSPSQFFIDIQTLTNGSEDVAGAMSGANWDLDQSYQWRFLVADMTTFTSANFDASWFSINTSSSIFKNTINGSFSVARGDTVGGASNELYIVYAAVPEPGTLALAGIGLGLAGWLTRRRRT